MAEETGVPEPQSGYDNYLWQEQNELPLSQQIGYTHSTWPAQTNASLEYVSQTDATAAFEAETIGELL